MRLIAMLHRPNTQGNSTESLAVPACVNIIACFLDVLLSPEIQIPRESADAEVLWLDFLARLVELSVEYAQYGYIFINAVRDWQQRNCDVMKCVQCPIGNIINSVRILNGTAMLCEITEGGDIKQTLCNVPGFVATLDLVHRVAALAKQKELASRATSRLVKFGGSLCGVLSISYSHVWLVVASSLPIVLQIRKLFCNGSRPNNPLLATNGQIVAAKCCLAVLYI